MPITNVLGSTIFHEERGEGPAFIFLHGNPTSSHIWRNVLSALDGLGRLLAPDLIGMGRSGKPDIAYTFDDQARYLAAWIEALGLDDMVLVGFDWGGALAMDWAARHPGRVRGLVLMETIVRPYRWSDMAAGARPRYEALRGAGTGEAKVLEENFFIEQALRLTTLRGIDDADLEIYRQPFPIRESRIPLLQWPRAMPIEGEPRDVVERVEAYDRWLAESMEVPKLLLTFDGSPETLLIGPDLVDWCRQNIAALEVVGCGPARHLVPEDQPEVIAAAIRDWSIRHRLDARPAHAATWNQRG
jgi:haloalkane dehalogenase